MQSSRRTVLRVLAGSGAVAAVAPPVSAAAPLEAPPGALGMLYDTTRCIGCKACVVACREANDLAPDTGLDGLHQPRST